jgi:hypothetical protein
MPFRLAMLTPFAGGLAEHGVDLRLWDLSAADATTVESEVVAYRPTLIHAFHAYRVGPLALRLAQRVAAPLVITLTGTDANHDLVDPERGPVVQSVLDRPDFCFSTRPSSSDAPRSRATRRCGRGWVEPAPRSSPSASRPRASATAIARCTTSWSGRAVGFLTPTSDAERPAIEQRCPARRFARHRVYRGSRIAARFSGAGGGRNWQATCFDHRVV